MHKHLLTQKNKRLLKRFGMILLIISALLLTIIEVFAVTINEIMYNPEGNDANREWIEIASSACVDLTAFRVSESGTQHTIAYYRNGSSCTYSVICDDCTALAPMITASVPLYKSTFSLSNSGEYLAITASIANGTSIIDAINYSALAREGYSIEFVNGSWIESLAMNGSPGQANHDEIIITHENTTTENSTQDHSMTENNTLTDTLTDNSTNNNTDITINNTITTDINTTINTTDPTADPTDTNTTLHMTENVTENISLTCNYTLSILLKENRSMYTVGESIKFSNRIAGELENYSIEYWVEDLFGNTLKNRINTTNPNEKTYTPTLDENDRVILIRNRMTSPLCAINQSDVQQVIIKAAQYKSPTQSTSSSKSCSCSAATTSCTITASTTKSASTSSADQAASTTGAGNESRITLINISEAIDTLALEVEVYKGNTRKSVVDVAVIDAKNRSMGDHAKIRLNEKWSTTTLTIPLHLVCKTNLGSANLSVATLTLIGLDQDIRIPLNTSCKNITQPLTEEDSLLYNQTLTSTSKNAKTAATASAAYENSSINRTSSLIRLAGNTVYDSPNQKSKSYALIGLVILAIIGGTLAVIRTVKKNRGEKKSETG